MLGKAHNLLCPTIYHGLLPKGQITPVMFFEAFLVSLFSPSLISLMEKIQFNLILYQSTQAPRDTTSAFLISLTLSGETMKYYPGSPV